MAKHSIALILTIFTMITVHPAAAVLGVIYFASEIYDAHMRRVKRNAPENNAMLYIPSRTKR